MPMPLREKGNKDLNTNEIVSFRRNILLLKGFFCFLLLQPEEKQIMTPRERETETERRTTSAFIPTMKPPGAVRGDTLDKQSH